jgi:hypothetical protein
MQRDVSIVRLHLLRATYLLLTVGLGTQIWPLILQSPSAPPAHMQGVVRAVLTAVSLLALLGLRYPLQLLPLLLFELTWKTVWVLAIGLPLWRAGRLDAATSETWFSCLAGLVIFSLAIPWGYVLRHYVRARGDRWRDASEPRATAPRSGIAAPAP